MNPFRVSNLVHGMLKHLVIAAAVLLLVMGDSTAQATFIATVTTEDGNGADSFINTGNATNRDTNFGNSNLVTAKLASTTPYPNQVVNRKGYVRFDISGYDLSAAPNAVFKFYTAGWNGTGTLSVYGLNDGNAGETWIEGNGGTGDSPVGEIDWNNAPANSGTAATTNTFVAAESTLLGTFTFGSSTDGTERTFSSAALNSFLLADSNGLVTLMFVRTTASDALNTAWASKEHVTYDPPKLEFNAVPEPGTFAMMLFGGVFLWFMRKKG